MRAYYFIVISGLVIIMAMLLYPTAHTIVGEVDTTGFLPLTRAGITLAPYAFLGLALYIIFRKR